MATILDEEINRIKLLFGESLLYGNINNGLFNLNEQFGRYFKKVWDDFKTKNPISAKKFDDVSVKRFTETDIKSIDDFFSHVETNAAMWKALGIDPMNVTMLSKLKKQIVDRKNPSILFEKSSSNKFFFEYVPVEGNLRGELFYWFSKKYPNEWLAGIRKVGSEANTPLKDVTALGGETVPTKPVDNNLPVKRSEVRVDSEGRCLDFNYKGEPIDVDGKLIEIDTSTGKPTGDFLPVVDDGGKINIQPDPNPPTVDEPGVRRFIGDMEGRTWDERAQRAAAANYFGYWIDRLMPKVSEFFKQVFGNKNYEAARLKFNDLVFNELNNLLQGDAVTAAGNIQRIRANINDAFIDFYRTLDGDPDFDNLNFNGVWKKMMDEFDETTPGLTSEERAKCKHWFENMKNQVESDLLADGLLQPSGRPNIAAYMERVGLSEKGWLARGTDKLVLFYKQCVLDLIPFIKKDGFWPGLYNTLVTVLQTVVRPAWNIFIRGSLLTPKAIKLFLGTESRILGYTLRPFSKEKYAALLLRNLVMTKFVFPFIQATYISIVQFAGKGVEIETGLEASTEKKGVGWWAIYGRNLAAEFTEELKGASEGDTMDLIVQWFPGFWDDALLAMSDWSDKDTTGEGEATKKLKSGTKKFIEDNKLDPNKAQNAEEIVNAELQREKTATEKWNTMKDALGIWVEDEGRKDLKPNARKLEKLLKPNTRIIKSIEEVNSEVKNVNPEFKLDGKKYYVISNPTSMPIIRSEDGSEQNLIQFLDYKKNSLDKIEESMRYNKNRIMENSGKKFGEDNFKHWNDTFIFKTEDKKNPGQYKEVKISMEDVMDRIDHYRKKYDEDDAFVRAVVDTHDDVVKIMYTKGLADIHESASPRGLALVLRTLNESRGEMEIFSVARPANGNWFLVKGDFTQSQLANMDLEKKEPEDKKKEKEVSGSEELKKKEKTAIETLKTNEREGLEGLPKKIRHKVLEKMGKGWTTESLPEFLKDLVTKSEINSIFNDKIKIYKLDSNDKTFDSIVANSSRIFIKRGFCRSLYVAAENASLNNKQEMVVNHILKKCDTKFAGKLGVRNF